MYNLKLKLLKILSIFIPYFNYKYMSTNAKEIANIIKKIYRLLIIMLIQLLMCLMMV